MGHDLPKYYCRANIKSNSCFYNKKRNIYAPKNTAYYKLIINQSYYTKNFYQAYITHYVLDPNKFIIS